MRSYSQPWITQIIRALAVLDLAGVMIGGSSCAYHHGQGDRADLTADEKHMLDSLAFTIVADLRRGDRVGARQLVASDRALNDFLRDDSLLVASPSVMRSASLAGDHRAGDQATVTYLFESAPKSSRCPHETKDTIRNFVFVKRSNSWLLEYVDPVFC
ncbi:MAG TPA: hypothetical protein VGJ18_07950 [Gemmatimonadaceae bacterium]|jgi:hypothetical protein